MKDVTTTNDQSDQGGQVDYVDLEARLTDPSVAVASADQVRTGSAAAAAGRDFLLDAYGSMEAVEQAMRPGRPRLGARRGASPAVRGRLADAEYAAFKELERRTGRSQSELVRQAVHQLLVDHKLVS